MAEPARILFVVPPFTGHLNPTLGVGAELLRRGHRVGWCGYPGKLGALPVGGERLALVADGDPELVAGVLARGLELRGLRSVQFFHEELLVPLAHAMVPGVREAVDRFRPDVLVVDQQALAGAVVGRERGLRWLTSCTTSAGMMDPGEVLPGIGTWLAGLFEAFQARYGLEARPRPGDSEHGVIVFSTEALVGRNFGDRVHFVGPVSTGRAAVEFPWERLESRRRLLVTLGTISPSRGEGFYQAVVDGLADEDLQVVLVAPAELVPELPPNFLRRDFVPQVQLLAKVDAVVSHGGHNTVAEALAAGKPLVVAPIRDDQPVVAAQVVAAGAGVRVRFGRITGRVVRESVRTVLTEPGFREAASRIAESFRAAGGASRAADLVEGTAT